MCQYLQSAQLCKELWPLVDSWDHLDLSERGNVEGMQRTLRCEFADGESSQVAGAPRHKFSHLEVIMNRSDDMQIQHKESDLITKRKKKEEEEDRKVKSLRLQNFEKGIPT